VSIEICVIGSATREIADFLRSPQVVISSAPLSELLRLAQPGAKLPHVLVLDVRQQTELPPALPLVRKEHPGTNVVIVASKLDPNLMLEAMRAGVTEWVVDPVRRDDLVSAVERASGKASAPVVSGEVLAILGAKGGVGGTTIAVNVATILATQAKSRALLIDLHQNGGGDAALFLGAEPSFSLADALENTHRLDEAFLKGIVVKTTAGPDLLASADRPASGPPDASRVRAVVEAAARHYRFVVLDVPRADPTVDEALALASSVTIVATQELAAIRAASRMAERLRQRIGADKVRIVLNRYDRTAEIGTEDLERAVGSRIGHKFPSNYRLAIDALNKGRPLVVDNHNKLAGAFAAYARSLSGTNGDRSAAQKSGGLFGRLTGRR
jgi:pilus assembly protein CpaE